MHASLANPGPVRFGAASAPGGPASTQHAPGGRRQEHPKVMVAGEVEYPHTVDLHDLAELADEEVSIDFHCHEGWSRLGRSYRGVALRTLLRLARARPAARYVKVASGGYSVVLTREQAEDERVLLALERDGAPLAGPGLVGPSEWDCFLSVKHVDRIELTRTAQRATGPSIALARIGLEPWLGAGSRRIV